MALALDRRETSLSRALADQPHEVTTLPVGDVLCAYEDGRSSWIAERKTARDLAASIRDGRWQDQLARLHAANYAAIFFFVEGDLRGQALPHKSLLGACLNAQLRRTSHLVRTVNVEETAVVVRLLAQKGGSPCGLPPSLGPPRAGSKRQRDAEVETCWARQLMCVPSISERIARALLRHFGSLPALQQALGDLQSFPRVRLSERECLGETRLKTLAAYLGPRPPPAPPAGEA